MAIALPVDALVSMVEKMSVPPTPTLKLDAVTIPEALTVLNTEWNCVLIPGTVAVPA